VFVKSGNNGDGTDNGVGEEVSVTDTGTDCEPGTGEGTNPDTGQDGDDGQDGAPGEDGQDGAPGEDGVDAPQVEGDVVQNPVTPVTPATPAQPGVNPAAPASPAVLNASDRNPQVLGAQTVRTLPRTGAGTNNLVPFGLGLVLLGFAIQRKSKTLSAARVR
jgi:LPXTG-motif cell wall-anchored protein